MANGFNVQKINLLLIFEMTVASSIINIQMVNSFVKS